MKLTGQLSFNDIGVGTWTFTSTNKQRYQLTMSGALAKELRGLAASKVEIEGDIKDETLTLSMTGDPVFALTSATEIPE